MTTEIYELGEYYKGIKIEVFEKYFGSEFVKKCKYPERLMIDPYKFRNSSIILMNKCFFCDENGNYPCQICNVGYCSNHLGKESYCFYCLLTSRKSKTQKYAHGIRYIVLKYMTYAFLKFRSSNFEKTSEEAKSNFEKISEEAKKNLCHSAFIFLQKLVEDNIIKASKNDTYPSVFLNLAIIFLNKLAIKHENETGHGHGMNKCTRNSNNCLALKILKELVEFIWSQSPHDIRTDKQKNEIEKKTEKQKETKEEIEEETDENLCVNIDGIDFQKL